MKMILKYLRFHPKKQAILIQPFALQLVVRLTLSVLPFYVTLGILQRIQRVTTSRMQQVRVITHGFPSEDLAVPQNVAWAICTTSSFVPKSRCLCQAIAGQILMSVKRVPTELRIGVRKPNSSMLTAHAWLVRNDVILIGNLPDIDDFIPLPALPEVFD
jgi:hypothetical protein